MNCIVAAADSKDEAELAHMKDSHDQYIKGKSGRLYEALTLVLTGIQCLGRASAVFESLTKDKALELELERAIQLIKMQVPAKTLAGCDARSERVPRSRRLGVSHGTPRNARSGSSAFREAHSACTR